VRALLDKLMLAPKTDADEKQNANVRLDLEEEVDRWANECDYAILKGRFEHLESEIATKEGSSKKLVSGGMTPEELAAKIKEMEEALEKAKKKAAEDEEANMQAELQAARDKAAGEKTEFDDAQQQALDEFMADQKAELEKFKKEQKDAKAKKEKQLMDDKAEQVKKRQEDLQDKHDKDVKKIQDGNHEPVYETKVWPEHKIYKLTEEKEQMADALDATVKSKTELNKHIKQGNEQFEEELKYEEVKFGKAEEEIAGKSKRSFC